MRSRWCWSQATANTSTVRLACRSLSPKLPVGLAPAKERASGGHARIYVGEDGPVTLDGDWHLDVEIPDASVGAAGVDAFRE